MGRRSLTCFGHTVPFRDAAVFHSDSGTCANVNAHPIDNHLNNQFAQASHSLIMDYPDELCTVSQMTLEDFVKASQFLDSQCTSDDTKFIRFNMAGRFELNGVKARIAVNSRQGNSLLGKTLHRRSDIDSVIGVSHDLPFIVPLAVFPLASFRDTLKASNHLKYKPNPDSAPANVSYIDDRQETEG